MRASQGEPYQTLIRGGRVIGSGPPLECDVAIDDGVVVALLDPAAGAEARTVIDAIGRLVLPGLVDLHAHFSRPGRSCEDWYCGSRAAVAGGVTTLADMPGAPLLSPVEDVELRLSAAAGASLVDYTVHGALRAGDPRALTELKRLADRGLRTVRLFDDNFPAGDLERLDGIFALAAERGVRLLVQAVDQETLELARAWLGEPDRDVDHERRWPRAAGLVAAARLISLARRHGTDLHLLSVSGREEADLVAAAVAAGLPVSYEVSGHHLSFVGTDVYRFGARALLEPPAREPADQKHLWDAVCRDETVVVSDHSPHWLTEKLRGSGQGAVGLPGVQEMLPVLYTGLCRARGLSTDEAASVVANVLSRRPAELLGLAGRKGAVEPGWDADIVIFDPGCTWAFDAGDVQAKCGWSAYEGWTFLGRAELTLRRGEIVYDKRSGEATFGGPTGRLV